MATQHCDIGMIGLGVMGLNFALNLAEHGYTVACYDKDPSKVEGARRLNTKGIEGTTSLKEFIASLKLPRVVMLLIPAGPPVDSVIEELLPHLQKGDLILDGGNSYYKDTDVRSKRLEKAGIHFFGVGVSGGEEGARHGPSLMPGGPQQAYSRIAPLLESAAAKVEGAPCVTYLGPRSAGHFVKMVHNGIEYGIMQLIGETYDIMKRGLGLNDDALSEVYTAWNQGELESYLLRITAPIFKKKDEKTGKRLIDVILDSAMQLGTGMWTTQSAMELQVPTPTIDLAVGMRNLSMQEEVRKKGSQVLRRPIRPYQGSHEPFLEMLRQSFYIATFITYAQGLALLKVASEKLGYQLDLEKVASIWRGGCIIQGAQLEEIRKAYQRDRALPNLLFDPEISQKILEQEESLRTFLAEAAEIGVPLPGFTSALTYLDDYRSDWLPANLIQAQRDYFGSHAYERKDAKGTFHTEWEKS
jgi:6-phosphogluconate dehydrogenase